jgi:hypothetical protein
VVVCASFLLAGGAVGRGSFLSGVRRWGSRGTLAGCKLCRCTSKPGDYLRKGRHGRLEQLFCLQGLEEEISSSWRGRSRSVYRSSLCAAAG